MSVHLIRHARAGERFSDEGPDDLRPLNAQGAKQAKALADRFAQFPVARVLSSQYLRCRQTVEPVADHFGLTIEEHPALLETADVDDLWALLEDLITEPGDTIVCTHGNLIGPAIDRLSRRGVSIADRACEKASTWSIAGDQGQFTSATYAPPA